MLNSIKISTTDRHIKGIMFDMDNTLLQSRIDFKAMKTEIFEFLVENEALSADFPVELHTSSTMMLYVREQGIDEELDRTMLDIAVKHELIGMEGAGLEQGVVELLNILHHRYKLVVVTNNAYDAAVKALDITGIAHYFDLIIGRDQMTAMKPSPSGYQYVLDEFKHIAPDEWLSIGDAWIDGRASIDAGVPFISYVTSMDEMRAKGVEPIGQVDDIIGMLDYLK